MTSLVTSGIALAAVAGADLISAIFMPKRAINSSLGTFSAYITLEEHHHDELVITDHPVEQGAQITLSLDVDGQCDRMDRASLKGCDLEWHRLARLAIRQRLRRDRRRVHVVELSKLLDDVYEFYGKPCLVLVCKEYGINWRALDDGNWTNSEDADGMSAEEALRMKGLWEEISVPA